ncbi:hypothetical protein F2Q69_00000229 [Brassica cretica]|uniref:Peptide N-acetyl-beta-D-glucosaminyl asparaginase amidase A N-terminal domain-containing protein n=1 Tax=Brassica cretica TaxID=69181 RepID=A0A8S9PDW0_BRACR|nr:hypothetical protein F2Q69_00000229 [Brassica cretica]
MSKMNQNGVVKFFTALAFLTATTVSLPSSPDRFLKSALTSLRSPALHQEYQELTLPSPSDHLTPSCSHLLLRHSFADTINKPPFTAPYTPPPSDCASPPWSRVILDLRAASSGDQYDRISGLWLGGVELLRTSTAEPSPTGIFWKIISRQSPADLIVPVSNDGVWFMIENAEESYSNRIQLPLNTRKIVLELYVSSHGNDEFWYSNPPDFYIETNKLAITRGNGAYREVVVKIDGRNVGSEVPFPVIFTGGINPLFWEPVVGIGAFNLPSYDIDLTPFLGMLLDGKAHEFALSVNNGISYWLVDANLHLWLDHGASSVEAGGGFYENPKRHMVRRELLEELDGSFNVEAEVRSEFDGWVKSSEGNLTTRVKSVFKLGSLVKFEKDGAYKRVEQRVESKRVVEVTTESGKRVDRVVQQRLYPRTVITSTLRGLSNDKDMYVLVTNVSQALNERYSVGEALTEVYNRQDSDGWMQVEDHNVLAGEARTRQSLRYIDEFGCYSRTIVAANGEIDQDSSTDTCPSSSSS